MGSFYVNLTVRSRDREAIGNLLAGHDAFISPVLNGVVLVYDKDADSQDEEIIVDLAKLLANRGSTAVLATLNHDDDILIYWLFDRGVQIDTYNSAPDYFADTTEPRGPLGGNAKVLCEAFGSKNIDAVLAVLRKPGVEADDGYVFALDRHRDLLQALGMTSQAFFLGYNYLEAGEYPEDLNKADFIEVGGKP